MKNISQIVRKLLPEYLAARRQELPKMTELLAASDFERLRILGHNLKGSGGSFGIPELSKIGAALERSAEEGDAPAFSRELGRLREFLEHSDASKIIDPDAQ